MPKRISIVGKRFGRLKCLARSGRSLDGRSMAIFECECGQLVNKKAKDVTRSRGVKYCSRSCPLIGSRGNLSQSKVYQIWYNMMARCYNYDHPEYHRYGGRDISVCHEWRDFLGFQSYIGSIEEGLYIDRIDPDGNYNPENIRFVDRYTSCQNTRRSIPCSYNGVEYKSIRSAALANGFNPRVFKSKVKILSPPKR